MVGTLDRSPFAMSRTAAPRRDAPPSVDRLPLERPDLDRHAAAAESAAREVAAARGEEALGRALQAWDLERARVLSARALAESRHARDCRRGPWRADQDFFDGAAGALLAAEATVARALVEHATPFEVAAVRGPRALERAAAAARGFSAAALPCYVEEAGARTRAGRLLACAEGTLGGERFTLAGLAARALAKGRDARIAAMEERLRAIEPAAGDLDDAFARIQTARRAIAAASGLGTPGQAAFARAPRGDYNPFWAREMSEEAGRRASLLRIDVLRVQGVRAERTSTDAFDERLHDALPSPAPALPRLLAEDVRAFLRVSGPAPEDAFDEILARGALDLEDRPGKSLSPRAHDLVDPPLASIVCAAAGSRDDVSTLAGALGEAYRIALAAPPPGWFADPASRPRAAIFGGPATDARDEPPRDRSPLEARLADGPTRALCAATMRLLAFGAYETFFGRDAERARLAFMGDLLSEIAMLAALDRFEHQASTWAGASSADLDLAFRAAEEAFLPWRTYEATPSLGTVRARLLEPLLYEDAFAAQDRLFGTVAALAHWGAIAHLDRRAQAARVTGMLRWASRAPFFEVCRRAGIEPPLLGSGLDAALAPVAAWLDARR